mmetsp:Transcript_40632/g.117514  ORF Transcript_40632/g.117514 Transcript_40632/m.117514 type:complete len:207 (-) Transcript_40632:286-906(-)
MVEIGSHAPRQQGPRKPRRRQREHRGDAERDGDGLSELELQRGDDGQVDVRQGENRALKSVGVLDCNHRDFRLVLHQLYACHLGDAPLLVVGQTRRSHARALVPACLHVLPQVGASEDAGRFNGGNGGEVYATEEAQGDAEEHLHDVYRQYLVHIVQALPYPDVQRGDVQQRGDAVLEEACDGFHDAPSGRHVLQPGDVVHGPLRI